MAREYAKTNLAIWQDPDWRNLPWPAQHVYKMFWEHPGLSYCGVVDWRPAKMLGWGAGWTRGDFDSLTDCLQARHFLVVDETTEECLIRSWVRFDGVLRQPRLSVSLANAFYEVGSNTLRGVIVDELAKLQEREPDAHGWSKSAIQSILGLPRIEAKSLPVPGDPFEAGFEAQLTPVSGSVSGSVLNPFGRNASEDLGVGFGVGFDTPRTSTSTSTDAPASPETSSLGRGRGRKRPAHPLPDDWAPNEACRNYADEHGIDVDHEADQFRSHAKANDRRQADWHQSFRNWLGKAKGWGGGNTPQAPVRRLPTADELEEPPSGLSVQGYREWQQAKRGRI